MHDSIQTIHNTIVFVYNITRFLMSYNLSKMKFYYSDYTSNIMSDYRQFVKIDHDEAGQTVVTEEVPPPPPPQQDETN